MHDVPANTMVREVARTGALSFAGSLCGALLGFALTLVLARALGSSGTGVVLQVMAVFTIAVSFARSGMDTAVVYLVPRLLIDRRPEIPGALLLAVGTAAVVGATCAGAIWLLAPDSAEGEALRAAVWSLPFAAAMMVVIAALRALGSVAGFVLVGQVLVPFLRPVGVIVAVAAGGAAVAASFAWALPAVVGLVVALVLLRSAVRRRVFLHPRGVPHAASDRTVFGAAAGELSRFARGRIVATTLEQALVWVDVLMVGLIAGSAAAGVYGTAARFVAAGLVVDSALRFAVAPMFSSLLHESKVTETRRLFSQVTVWLVLLSTPVYLLLAVYAPLVLGWLGEGFRSGTTTLVVLCAGTALTLAAGNIHSVLLMSGRSGWSALNKAVVLALNVIGNLLLVPVWGIEAAAVCWAVCMLVDAAMASVEVAVLVGVRARVAPIGYALAVVLLTVGAPALVLRVTMGATLPALLCSVLVGGGCLLVWCLRDQHRLQVTELVGLARRRLDTRF